MININYVYNDNCINILNTFDNNSLDLVIADPPYFRILKDENWDRFKNVEEYVEWSKQWIKLCTNKLRYSGTLLLYGCTRNFDILCRLNQLLLDNGMYFVQEIILDKGIKSVAGRISDKIKMLPPVSENILVYRKDAKPYVRNILTIKQQEYKYPVKYIKEQLGMATNGGGNWTKYCGNTEFPLLPTEEHWNGLRKLFNIDLEYKYIQETYNGILGLTNVWSDINFYIKNRKHPCEKPLELCKRTINIFSRENDFVFIPFGGSGNDALACKELNRTFIITETNINYYNIIKERICVD